MTSPLLSAALPGVSSSHPPRRYCSSASEVNKRSNGCPDNTSTRVTQTTRITMTTNSSANTTTGDESATLLNPILHDRPQLHWFLIVLLFAEATATCVGNLFVLHVVRSEKRKAKQHLYVANLALADAGFGFTEFFYAAQMSVGSWPFGSPACTAWLIADTVFGNAVIFIVLVVAVDRVMAVMRPHRYSVTLTRASVAAMLVAWATALARMLLVIDVYTGTGRAARTCRPDWSRQSPRMHLYLLVLLFYVPMVIIAACCMKIAAAVLMSRIGKVKRAAVTPVNVVNRPATLILPASATGQLTSPTGQAERHYRSVTFTYRSVTSLRSNRRQGSAAEQRRAGSDKDFEETEVASDHDF
ncbi:PREDICTED: somatostatin receptor type 5-like [Priapulus caudatus]|uniref:Somatostatin receptor type 5-like n=1 Tax=Priapulus caudatus TaxID=37621 RepID=A0ABM1E015_PRICU|nr:PREDICTED: somatostatin receptor type 5-like [Priapulus caudatus]